MAEYFNNGPFLRSIPENGNSQGNSNTQMILYITLAVSIGVVAGFIIQQQINKKLIVKLNNENQALKNRNNRM